MTPAAEAVERVSGSFRDPSGHVFSRNGRILRQVNRAYAADYDHLLASGLYRTLVDRGLLVAHVELGDALMGADGPDAYKVLEPERIPYVSYPFEWAFSALKEAALATLAVQRAAVEHGMVLKDASAFNVQFRGAAPVLIDTLSFEIWREDSPWLAYRQFCQHFLGPLALMARADGRLGSLSRVFIDGVPLDLVTRLLPLSSALTPALLVHLYLHARAQRRHGSRALPRQERSSFGRRAMLGLVDHLEAGVESLRYAATGTAWVDYYDRTNYSTDAMADKERIVRDVVARVGPRTVWDLGANTGTFSHLAARQGAYTVAFDADPAAVERHYLACRGRQDGRVLPLVMDLTNPSGRLGWSHGERMSLCDRGPADLVMALGLLHHLALANQTPFGMVADFLRSVGRMLLVEFVPRTDSQVASMLSRMPQHDERYSLDLFEREFARAFDIIDVVPIRESARRLYLMRAKASAS